MYECFCIERRVSVKNNQEGNFDQHLIFFQQINLGRLFLFSE